VALHWASLLAALVCVVLRYRASRGTQRQQLRWVGAGAAAAVIGLLLAIPGAMGLLPNATTFVLYVGLLCPPMAVAVAVLRYRLWDLDRLVSRTVTYALVTALLVVPYLLIVPAAGRLAAGSGSLAVAAATLAAAALFAPLRRRVQELVDRRFNRRRYDAARTVEQFAARLRDQVDLDALSAELLAMVDQTMQPSQAWLWLRPPALPRPRSG
jgi:4-amino-4-deoxy-L-arabinose transferase-like glycosyltransferase